MSSDKFSPVALNHCNTYDTDTVYSLLCRQFALLGIGEETFSGKNVVLKPNLVMSKSPEAAATTHPSVLRAAGRLAKRLGAKRVTVAESWGGPYTEALIKNHYKGCGIRDAAEAEGIELNCSAEWDTVEYKEGRKCRSFSIIKPIIDADVIINLPKLKTHSLTGMSAAVKNFFGTVPGIQKFEMHARFPEISDFSEMICDLCEMLCKRSAVISVCDGILGMEGNGPTGGEAKEFGVLLTSRSPFCLDTAAKDILGIDSVTTVDCAVERGLCPAFSEELEVLGDSVSDCSVGSIKLPDSQNNSFLKKLPTFMGGKAARFFQPRPKINKATCVGCGKCKESCPMHTIVIVDSKNGKNAKIERKNCIHCYCCQELCPINSVKVVKNPIIRLVH